MHRNSLREKYAKKRKERHINILSSTNLSETTEEKKISIFQERKNFSINFNKMSLMSLVFQLILSLTNILFSFSLTKISSYPSTQFKSPNNSHNF